MQLKNVKEKKGKYVNIVQLKNVKYVNIVTYIGNKIT